MLREGDPLCAHNWKREFLSGSDYQYWAVDEAWFCTKCSAVTAEDPTLAQEKV